MALQLGALRDVLIEAGASAPKPEKELANYDRRLATMDVKLEKLSGSVQVVQWMLGTNVAISLGILWRLLWH